MGGQRYVNDAWPGSEVVMPFLGLRYYRPLSWADFACFNARDFWLGSVDRKSSS
jgi:hypothetical protein